MGMAILQISLLLLFATACFSLSERFAKAKNNTSARGERMFSLFSIVQFPNEACSSTSGTYSNGTCFTANECSSKGGSAQGNCAAGFGVCCVFSVSASGSTISQNCSYIVNPSYPSNYAPTLTPAVVSYTIEKCSNDICRIRLDYDTLILTQPTAAATAATAGQCATDRLELTTTAQTTAPATGALGTYGDYPYLCGTNTGYHSYLDVSNTDNDKAYLSFTLGDATLNQWKIKVTQLSCDDYGVAAQAGCFQYHTGTTGTIQSYNLVGAIQLVGTNYKNCIRQESGYCCIEYTPVIFTLGPIACAAAATRCASVSTCSQDYILIPEVQNPSGTAQPGSYDRFCGTYVSPTGISLESAGIASGNNPLTTCKTPFELAHTTSVTGLNGAATTVQVGYQFTYRQIPGGC